jgi:hypothetical protein
VKEWSQRELHLLGVRPSVPAKSGPDSTAARIALPPASPIDPTDTG